jgi:RecA/RadA recombinase
MSNWKKALKALPSAVDFDYDAFAPENCLYTPSPSLNWIFANKSMGIPKGTGTLLWGRPKGGKSLIIQAAIAEMHKRDPEGIALIYSSEMRGFLQDGSIAGVDKDRLVIIDSNRPEVIFDEFETTIDSMMEEGMPLRIVALDSLNSIGGTKALDGKSVNDHLMGDKAITVQRGLEKMLPIVRKRKLVMFATAQVRDNFDAGPHGPKEKMAASWSAKHAFEYYVNVRRAEASDDKVDLSGAKFEDDEKKDIRGNKEITGHKIIAKMDQNSVGTPGRSAQITFSYKHGIINQNEEVFELAKNLGIIENVGAGSYVLYGQKIRGKAEVGEKIKESVDLQKKLLEDIRKLDLREV